MIDNYCEFFKNIEENPSAIVKGLTVRDFYNARAHLYNCDVCFNRSERVIAQAPKETIIDKLSEN